MAVFLIKVCESVAILKRFHKGMRVCSNIEMFL